MNSHDFTEGWTWKPLGSDADYQPVQIPHDAMLAEPRSADSAGGTNTGWFAGRDYSYRKTFSVPETARGQRWSWEFEGIYHDSEVRLNGVVLARHPSGYIAVVADAGSALRCGQDNVLEVLARNANQPNSRWYTGAGIYRPVVLHKGPAQGILLHGLKVQTISLSPATVSVCVKTSGDGPVRVVVRDQDLVVATGELVSQGGEAQGTLTWNSPRPWSPEDPHLYRCEAQFGDDLASASFGLRLATVGPDGLLINGQRVILRGACIHHDNGILGARAFADAEERKVRLLQEAGYNAIRSAHNPCSRYLLEACDRLGMLVMDEYADVWYIHKTRFDYADHLPDRWESDLNSLVDKDYNHPSVILYCLGNEVAETAQPRGVALADSMAKHLRQIDNRPVTCGINIFFNLLHSLGFGVYTDEKAAKSTDERAPKVGSEFFNTLAGLLGAETMKIGATLPGCHAKTKGTFAKLDVAGYNYGIRRYKRDLARLPQRLILGTETFCKDAASFWDLAKTEPRLIGDFVWAGMDYLGEVGIGAWEYQEYAPQFDHGVGWITAGAGRLDITGRSWGETLYTRVAFELEPGPRMAVQPVHHSGEKHSASAWRFSHAIESWTWPGCEGRTAVVEVYSRAPRVQLFLNGRAISPRRKTKQARAQFAVPYSQGTLEVREWDRAGRPLGTASLVSGSDDVELRLVAEKDSYRPGDLVYLRLRYTDSHGVLNPVARGTLELAVEGGTLLAAGNGCSYNERGYLTNAADTYYGEALAVVQVGASGSLRISAQDGKRQASLEIHHG